MQQPGSPAVYGKKRSWYCLPDFSVKEALNTGELRTIFNKDIEHTTTFHILWPGSRQMTPKVRVFVDYMTETFDSFMMRKPRQTKA
ncbi:hypothetical protein FQ626_18885 [Erwinia pyrifoliae]|nr:hypothetical protein [Erwinia pyrifoliae]